MSVFLFSLVCPRTEKAATTSNDDEDQFIARQFQQTLTELDDDLEGKEHHPCYLSITLCGSRLWKLFFLTTLCITT